MSGIAIVGLACRLPGADTPTAFWQNLCAGVDSVSCLSDEELRSAGVPPELIAHPGYVKAAAVIADADRFDASFFGFSPREAALLDPQQRLLLEVAWEAFEDAGYHPESYDGVAGVFAGGGGVVTSYLFAHAGHPAFQAATASVPHLGNDKDFLATRVSYKLNLTGPSITVQTACSTSLVAAHLACQSLRAGECDMALAAATTVRVPQLAGYVAEKGNVYSLDGRCRAFDAAGQGTLFGSGVAAVLLKRMEVAIADGDQIYAVIKGSAVNNDGGRKVSYPSPSVTGQARAMVEAFTLADCSPDTVRYVECHATGTTVGDPPEIVALTRAFRQWTPRSAFCAVGSVKTNIGHPEQTAGLAGVIKTALALRDGRIPPTLHFRTPNPKIDFAASPFFVNTELTEWPADAHPRRAAVNSLGIGGTNAFVVLEEAPPRPAADGTEALDAPGPHVLTLSAKTETAVAAYVERLAAFVERDPPVSVADLTYTSNVSRSQLPWRFAVTAGTADDLRAQLRAAVSGASAATFINVRDTRPRLALLFTGQGAQYPGMGIELYGRHPIFREALDRCASALLEHLDVPLLDLLAAEAGGAGRLDETRYTQPAIVAVQLALYEMWSAWGLRPAVVLGHSVGEIAAACVAGVLGLEDALRLVAERARLMQALPTDGAMVAVLTSETAVKALLRDLKSPVAIAAVNGPGVTVVSGKRDAVREVVARLTAVGVGSRPLRVSHAFHSPLMDPILEPLERAAQAVAARPPAIPIVSNVTGSVLDRAPDGAYWRTHARQCVRFADGLRTAHTLGATTFVEMGPGSTLAALGRTVLEGSGSTWIPTLPRPGDEWAATVDALARLYLDGVAIDWHAVHREGAGRRVSMPTYPFQRKRYWLEPAAPSTSVGDEKKTGSGDGMTVLASHPLLGPPVRDGNAVRFESIWSIDRLPYLQDHRVGGAVILPTALAVEAALAAGSAHFGRLPAIEGLVYHDPLRFVEGREYRTRVTLVSTTDDRANFGVASVTADGTWRTHVSGMLAVVPADEEAGRGVSPAAPCRRNVAPGRFYDRLRSLGLDYGPAFRGIAELRQGRQAAVSRVRLPSTVAPDGYGLHPAFLDACLHVFPATLGRRGARARRAGAAYLPIGVERVRVYQQGAIEGTVSAVLRDGSAGERPVVDLRVVDRESRPVLRVEGLTLHARPLGQIGDEEPQGREPTLYRVRWEARPRPEAQTPQDAEPGAWLIFSGHDGSAETLAAELRRHRQQCHLVRTGPVFARRGSTWRINPRRADHFHRLLSDVTRGESLPLRGTVFLWAADEAIGTRSTTTAFHRGHVRGAGAALFLTQALLGARARHPDIGRLWLVTRNVQCPVPGGVPMATAAAMLWGFGRTVAAEAPAIWGGLIDLPPAHQAHGTDAAQVALELLQPDGETQIALRHAIRHVARLDRLAVENLTQDGPEIRADATYLITGGLGMLGLRTAQHLVEGHRARSLVLVSRRPPSRSVRRTVSMLRAGGARVRVIAGDVGRAADVRRVLRAVRRLPPLRGVFHGAGILDDATLTRMTWSQLERVATAKVRGSWLLHEHTRALSLDHFVVHSSLLSVTGSPGQANYTAANAFLDALIDQRRATGLPGTALNWGPWADGGMARSTGARGEAVWKGRGIRYLAPESAMRALDVALRTRLASVVVADVDWPRFLQRMPSATPFYEAMQTSSGREAITPMTSAVADVQARLRSATGADRRALLVDVIRDQVMTELGFTEAVDTRQPLSELGLDSLMSVDLANRLETALGVPVPVAKLISGPSIDELAGGLLGRLGGVTPAVARPATAAASAAPAPGVDGPATAGDGWLVIPRPRPTATMRLVCFPFAGAGARPFRRWADALHPSIELVAIEPPGRASRIHEPPEQDLERFLARLGAALSPVLDRPAVFFGHCLGGLIGWEMARRLRHRGQLDLRAFFVAGVRPPHRLTLEGPFEHGLLERLLRHDAFDPLRPIHEQPDEVFVEVTRHFDIPATDEFLARPELRRLLLPAVRADFALTAAYRHQPEPAWDVPFTCFAGLDDPYVSCDDATAWGNYTRRAFRLHWRPGAHFLVVDDRDFIVSAINQELTA